MFQCLSAARLPAAITLLLLGISGCAYFPLAQHPRAAVPLSGAMSELVSYPKQEEGNYVESKKSVYREHEITRITLSVSVVMKNASPAIGFDYYRPRIGGRLPVIVIFPISGGGYALERNLADFFVAHGYAAIIADRDKEMDRNSENGKAIDSIMRQGIWNGRQLLDWIETRGDLDATRIGVIGTSMGAIKSALLTAADSRIKAATLLLAGGDLPHIIAFSDEPKISKKRDAYLAEKGIDQEALEALLRLGVTIDPIILAPSIDPKKVLLVLAALDTTVPFSSGWELRKAMGYPKTVVLFGNHYTALLYLLSVRELALEFFDARLAPRN